MPFINEEKAFEFEKDLVSGCAESYGVEFTLNYSMLPFNFRTSYSLGYAYKQLSKYIFFDRLRKVMKGYKARKTRRERGSEKKRK